MSRNSRYLFCAISLLLSVVLTVSAQAGKNGKGKPGGGDPPPPPPLPPVEYQVTHISLPYPADTSASHLNDFSDSGMAVGNYNTLAHERRAWLYDPFNPFSAVDLNDLPIIGLEGWVIHSAVGVNNNGLVVGYASPTGDPVDRQGVVIDLVSMEMFALPDTGWGWTDTYARKVNDNGDILGTFWRGDGTQGVYLYNPGLRDVEAADDDLEIIDVVVIGGDIFDLNNPLPGVPTQIVGTAADGSICEYTRGGAVSYRTDVLADSVVSLQVNELGDIAGNGTITVQVRKNKIERTNVLYRDTGVEEYLEMPNGGVTGLTNDGTVLTNSGDLYVDGWGWVDVHLLIAPAGPTSLGNNPKINNVGLPGFSQIAGNVGAELYVLTPVLITP